jgi:hypothetical protein
MTYIVAFKIEESSVIPAFAAGELAMDAYDPDIHLNIHSGVEVCRVVLKSHDSLRSVMRQFKCCSQFRAIYKNSVVSTGFSLAFLGIENGADIYTIPEPKADLPAPPGRFAQKACDRDTFDRMLSELHGPDCDEQFSGPGFAHVDRSFCHEMARLKDRFFERVEGNVRSHRKMLRNFFGHRKKQGDESESEDEQAKKK